MNNPNQHGPIDWSDFLKQAMGGSPHTEKGTGFGGSGFDGGNADFSHLKKRFAEMGKRSLIVLAILVILIAAFCYWWFHPPINIHSDDLWWFIAIIILLPSFIVFFVFRQIYQNGAGKREVSPKKAKLFKYLMAIPVVIALIGVLGAVTSLSLFPGNAERYSNILQTLSLIHI